MKKVLVIGCTGLVGSNVVLYLEKKYQVNGVSFRKGFDVLSISDFSQLDRDYDYVINCCGELKSSYVESVRVNVLGAINVANFAQEINAKLIHISSIFAIEHVNNEYYVGYGAIKKSADDLIINYSKASGLKFVILRLPQLFDDYLVARKSQGMLYRIIEQIALNQKVRLFGRKDPRRSFLHVNDAARILNTVMESNVTGVFNCPGNTSITILELVELIGRSLNRQPDVEILVEKQPLKSVYIPQDNLIWKEIDYRCQYSLMSSIPNIANNITRNLNEK